MQLRDKMRTLGKFIEEEKVYCNKHNSLIDYKMLRGKICYAGGGKHFYCKYVEIIE